MAYQTENIYTINCTKGSPSGCLLFLHGSGDTGPGLGKTIKYLKGSSAQFQHIKILFPTAPLLPFTAYGGMMTNTWYDISDFTEDAVENYEHIKKSADLIMKIVQKEISSGIPLNRIAVAGFSRGGAMSYYIGYTFQRQLAGVGVLSSWLPKASSIYEMLTKSNDLQKLPPLFQAHGSLDSVVSPYLAKKTCDIFTSAGIKTYFKTYPSVGHEVGPQTLDDLYSFVQSVIPVNPSL